MSLNKVIEPLTRWIIVLTLVIPVGFSAAVQADPTEWSVARHWNETLLQAIRNDFARPTIHARNLYHVSAAMWDSWAAYDDTATGVLFHEYVEAADIRAAREETISYAAFRILWWRFANSPGAQESLPLFDAKMVELGYDPSFTSTLGNSPAALGNRIAETYIEHGLQDRSNEANDYVNVFYEPINEPLPPVLPGNSSITDPNRWQPLVLEVFIGQGGNIFLGGYPEFLGPEWGAVTPFALSSHDLTVNYRDGNEYWVYHDPGPPPYIGGIGDAEYKAGFEQVVLWSGLLDPADGVLIDISPASRGNNALGTNNGSGYAKNPSTGLPYAPEIVPAGDYYRVLAEFWADGPESETPPGHWFTIANYVSDHPLLEKKLGGLGPELDDLEWDVKLYLALGGTMHDAAISAWGVKGWYDYTRPISAIRYMCDRGQSSEPGPSYDPQGITLYPGSIEVITAATAAPGGRHFGLGGDNGEHINKIAVHAWRGPEYIQNEETETAGVGWIRCEDWWPYQRPSFVTPPFAGYVSGHSTFSRAAAELMTYFTGDKFFPGGLGEFFAPKNEFLVFEDGPSVDITLQWATYADASDETSLSRIYGGIHPTADDIPGRFMGAAIAEDAWHHATELFGVTGKSRATFNVTKDFADGENPTVVGVTINCNTGLLLNQSSNISESQDVTFVLTDFSPGTLDCTITENFASPDLASYLPVYSAEGPSESDNTLACHFYGIEGGDHTCHISNHARPVSVSIDTQWFADGAEGADVDKGFQLGLFCDSDIVGGSDYCPGEWDIGTDPFIYQSCMVFAGSGDMVFEAQIIPEYPGSSCRVLEKVFNRYADVDNGCGSILVSAGQGATCQIINSIFFEGVPMLGQRGLVILILLMLGTGLIGFRRST